MCYFGTTKVEIIKFATIMANCVRIISENFVKEY